MTRIESIIGEGNTLELNFDSKYQQSDAESWWATLRQDGFNEDGDPLEGALLASARLFRVSVEYEDRFDELDVVSADLAAIGESFNDWSVLEDVDEESYFANSLLIVDFVSVEEAHRGSRLSHAFVRGIAHIFRNDAVALLPASMSSDDTGRPFLDERKREGLRRHWERGGFVQLPGSEVMILPMGAGSCPARLRYSRCSSGSQGAESVVPARRCQGSHLGEAVPTVNAIVLKLEEPFTRACRVAQHPNAPPSVP